MDEADRMLSMDFEQELNQILDVLPDSSSSQGGGGGGRRTYLFSATMTSKVQKLQRASLSNPVRIEVSTKFSTPKKLLQSYLFIPAKYKDCYLTYLINEHAGQTILVFGATCNNVQRLALMLRNLGFSGAICLHGQMSQPKRLGALHKFKSGGRDILICTDVAARGLDIPSVDVVINFDSHLKGIPYWYERLDFLFMSPFRIWLWIIPWIRGFFSISTAISQNLDNSFEEYDIAAYYNVSQNTVLNGIESFLEERGLLTTEMRNIIYNQLVYNNYGNQTNMNVSGTGHTIGNISQTMTAAR